MAETLPKDSEGLFELNLAHLVTVQHVLTVLDGHASQTPTITIRPKRWRHQGQDRIMERTTGPITIPTVSANDTLELRERRTAHLVPSRLPVLHGLGVLGMRAGLRTASIAHELEIIRIGDFINPPEAAEHPLEVIGQAGLRISITGEVKPFQPAFTPDTPDEAYLQFVGFQNEFSRLVEVLSSPDEGV